MVQVLVLVSNQLTQLCLPSLGKLALTQSLLRLFALLPQLMQPQA